jgi:hypothetical protein
MVSGQTAGIAAFSNGDGILSEASMVSAPYGSESIKDTQLIILISSLASMVSGQEGRNPRRRRDRSAWDLAASMVSSQEAGIRRNHLPAPAHQFQPQWCPVRTTEIRASPAGAAPAGPRFNGVRSVRPESGLVNSDPCCLGRYALPRAVPT